MKKKKKIIISLIIILIIIVVSICWIISFQNKRNELEKGNNNKPNEQKEESYNNNDYDGIYQFSYDEDNGNGYIYNTRGYLKVINGNCITIDRTSTNTTSNDYSKTEDYPSGSCKIMDNGKFEIVLNGYYSSPKYECEIDNKNLMCTSKSEFGISGCKEELVNFNYFCDLTDYENKINEVKEQEELAKKEQEEKKKREEEKKKQEELAKKERVFTAGTYKVGTDIEPGTYNIIAVSGRGNCYIHSKSDIIETFTPGGDQYAIDRYNNASLGYGGTIEVTSTLKVKFEAVN